MTSERLGRRTFVGGAIAVGAGLVGIGCGSGPGAQADAGGSIDSGGGAIDGGSIDVDAGPDLDAGPGVDAGPPPLDGGPPGVDGGPPPPPVDGGRPPPPVDGGRPPPACRSVAVDIADNHPIGQEHILMVPVADVTAGTPRTYDIMGNALHTHTITVSAAQFTTIRAGGTVFVTSTSTTGRFAHSHEVTLACA